MNQQQLNERFEPESRLGGSGLNAFYGCQIFALVSVVVVTAQIVQLAWILPTRCNSSSQRTQSNQINAL